MKEKVEAGADLVITQLFYDNAKFFEFREQCSNAGITVPIIPGILPIQNYQGFKRMTEMCKTFVPSDVDVKLAELQNDDEKVREFGVELASKMCQELMDRGVQFLHFYTLNLEKSTVDVLNSLQIIRKQKKFPWKKPTTSGRKEETVRPVFWSNKPMTYIARTHDWDEFPNGRWGVSRSPAFGEMSDYPSLSKVLKPDKEKRLKMWGEELTHESDVGEVIISFLKGQIKKLPWNEFGVHEETKTIEGDLMKYNTNFFFTTNSQP